MFGNPGLSIREREYKEAATTVGDNEDYPFDLNMISLATQAFDVQIPE